MSLLLEQITNHPAWKFFYGPELPIDLVEDVWKNDPAKASSRLADFLTPELLDDGQGRPRLDEVLGIYLRLCHWQQNDDHSWQSRNSDQSETLSSACAKRICEEWRMCWDKVLG